MEANAIRGAMNKEVNQMNQRLPTMYYNPNAPIQVTYKKNVAAVTEVPVSYMQSLLLYISLACSFEGVLFNSWFRCYSCLPVLLLPDLVLAGCVRETMQ